MTTPQPRTPILLLKTRSQPTDNYHAYFTTSTTFTPTFIPVLTHKTNLQPLLARLGPSSSLFSTYGGLIFTSQRAVEALDAALVHLSSTSGSGSGPNSAPAHAGIHADAFYTTHGTLPPLYTVGPATSRALQRVANAHFALATRTRRSAGDGDGSGAVVDDDYPVLGADTGNGEKLARFILETYSSPPPPGEGFANGGGDGGGDGATGASHRRRPRRPLLFFVGEQRRDIIPKTLMDEALPVERRVRVDEVVVYETAVEEGFEGEFGEALGALKQAKGEAGERVVWIVVFSPTGCEAMLRVLGWTREAGWPAEARMGDGGRRWRVATIGPTTRDFLRDRFGFEADVCAPKPSPEGIAEGIAEFERSSG